MAAADADQLVVLDLANCEFIDSTGLAVVVAAASRQRDGGGRLALCSPSEPVKQLLFITGLNDEGLVFGTSEQALQC